VLKHASRSRHIDPDRPPAAAGGLRSQIPDLVHGPRELLDCRPAAASCSRLVDENGLAFSTGGRRRASTWQLQLSHWAVRASTDEQRTVLLARFRLPLRSDGRMSQGVHMVHVRTAPVHL